MADIVQSESAERKIIDVESYWNAWAFAPTSTKSNISFLSYASAKHVQPNVT